MDRTAKYPDEQIGTPKFSGGQAGGASVMDHEATATTIVLDVPRQYARQAREILEQKGEAAGFDIATTAAGALLLCIESLFEQLEHPPTWSTDKAAWSGGEQGDGGV